MLAGFRRNIVALFPAAANMVHRSFSQTYEKSCSGG